MSRVSSQPDTGMAGQPRNVVFLTADAFGVLPPISRLTRAQAQYHFISGYTAKLAGTEVGVKEPGAPKPAEKVAFGSVTPISVPASLAV